MHHLDLIRSGTDTLLTAPRVAEDMSRKRTVLIVLAAIGWIGTLLSHLVALWTDEADEKRGWEGRRNRFLLLSSLTTNTLVLTTVYRYGKGLMERPRRQ